MRADRPGAQDQGGARPFRQLLRSLAAPFLKLFGRFLQVEPSGKDQASAAHPRKRLEVTMHWAMQMPFVPAVGMFTMRFFHFGIRSALMSTSASITSPIVACWLTRNTPGQVRPVIRNPAKCQGMVWRSCGPGFDLFRGERENIRIRNALELCLIG